jgi:cytidylate kinase
LFKRKEIESDWRRPACLPSRRRFVYAPMVSGADASGSKPLIVVIDGPAGAGKTTVARRVAAELALPLLDTGAIYRSLALVSQRRGVDWADESALADICADFPLRFEAATGAGGTQKVLFAGEDVSKAIRTPEISDGASRVSALPAVRSALLGIQRALAASGCVAEGRDMGTVVFPHAPHKFFLTADLEARARRRHAELVERAGGREGVVSLEELFAEMKKRDERDSQRATAPLRAAQDAVKVDSTQTSADGVVALVLERVRGS